MKYRVTAPVEGFSGQIGGVTFVNGVATADEETYGAALAYFRRRGYTVTPVDAPEAPKPGSKKRPAD